MTGGAGIGEEFGKVGKGEKDGMTGKVERRDRRESWIWRKKIVMKREE